MVPPRQREDDRSSRRSCRRCRALGREARRGRCSSTARSSPSTRTARPAGFQQLQGRIHLTGATDVARIEKSQPVALIAFDLLRDGEDDVRGSAADRAAGAARSKLLGKRLPGTALRISEQVGRGRRRAARARDPRGLGRADRQGGARSVPVGPAQPGVAQAEDRQASRSSSSAAGPSRARRRQYFGALLLGVHGRSTRPGALKYVGHTGTGFNQQGTGARLDAAQSARDRSTSPFSERDQVERARRTGRGPSSSPQIRFTEWTDDGKLRHPVYLGLRDDKKAARGGEGDPRQRGRRRGASERAAGRGPRSRRSRAEPWRWAPAHR